MSIEPNSPGGAEAAGRKIRVMIVDDEPDLAITVGELLKPTFEVVVATNGLEALDRIDNYEPDFIIMDVMMPVLNGFDTTRAIKKDARFAKVPVLFLTARTDNRAVREGMLSGADMYLEKPFSPDDLLERIEELLTRQHVIPAEKHMSIAEIERLYGPPQGLAVEEPAYEPSTPLSLSEQMAQASVEPHVRILVVDDDIDIINYVKTILRNEFEVIGTSDSETAPDKIMAYQPDILLLDIIMPKLSGFHLANLIRINKRLRGAKIVFLSTHLDPESIEKAYELGATDFIEKPFSPDQLRNKLHEIVKKPDFQRMRKRLDYREVLRREGEPTH